MKQGHKLFITANYGFDYNKGIVGNILTFDILTQFFEHNNNLEGFVDSEEGLHIEDGSPVAILVDTLYRSFDERSIPSTIEKLLLDFEMYEVLIEYKSPLDEEGLAYKEQLLSLN